ncbi:TPA: restriction endonuclease subunit S [Haemophilus influenzae]|uniref:restriction endonuclease subunit S n=1 Tax=Haemophilus influenzae TaxID=727 RepID=UPI001C8457F9|nr:restriction endonuclease subunit S [Haemophilus influenzae]
MDAEHYRKKYQISISKLSNLTTQRLGSLLSIPVCTGHTPSMQNDSFYGGSVKFIKTDNVRENKITDFFTDYLSDKGASELKKSNLISGDVITTIIGATYDVVGRAAMVTDELLPANINQNIALIRCNSNKINPYFLNCYLNTYIGRAMLHYHSRQTEQVNLNCREVERVLVPIFNNEFQKSIEELYKKSEKIILDSKIAYQTAQNLLLEHLGLKDFNPPLQKFNIKSFSNSFGTSGRLDAEFYQEKYEGYLKKIQAYPYGCEPIRTACKLKDANYTPKDNQTYQYIELSNIGNLGEITGASLDLGCNLPSRARRKVSKNDVIVSSVEGSLASCAIVSEQYHQALCSTGFYVVSSEKINSETLLILFKSEPIQQLLKQGCSGTILTAINKDEFLNIPLPLVDANIQTQIADLIRQSNYLRIKSKGLLEKAKKAVELAIEKDQESALDFIKGKQTNDCNVH